MKFDTGDFNENLSRYSKFGYNRIKTFRCRRDQIAIKELFRNTQYYYIVGGDITQQYSKHTVDFPLQQRLLESANNVMLYILHIAYLVIRHVWTYEHNDFQFEGFSPTVRKCIQIV